MSWAQEENPSFTSYLQSFNSDFLEVLSPGELASTVTNNYPEWLKFLKSDSLQWSPTGETEIENKNCHIQNLQDCEKDFRTHWVDPVSNMLGTMTMRLETLAHPYARHVMLHLPNGIRLKGLLALKADQQKRPLIILRTGIFSNSHEFYAERFLFFQIFEQSPFNVLLIESITGGEFVQNNTKLSIGGFDEGLTNYYIAKKLQQPTEPLSKIISEVHLLGVSMGGHGVFFATLLNDFNNSSVIASSLALCPLVNMKDTLQSHLDHPVRNWIINSWGQKRLQTLFEKYPELKTDYWIQTYLNRMNEAYQEPLIGKKALSQEKIKLPQERGDMWSLNNFWSFYQTVKTPITVIANLNDPIIPYELNSKKLIESQSPIPVITLPQGYHCTLPMAYDWHFMTEILQDYFLKHSHFSQKEISQSVAWPNDKSFKLKFEIPLQSENLRVIIEEKSFLSRFGYGPKQSLDIPLKNFDYHLFGPVKTEAEGSLFLRWAHQNIRAKKAGDQILLSWRIGASL